MSLKSLIHEYITDYMRDKKIYAQVGLISDINEADRTCLVTPINGDAERLVRFQASLSLTDGLFIVPVDGSYVIFSYLNNETGVIICYSEIEKVILNTDEIIINDGENGGLVKSDTLTSKLNIIEDSLNDLKSIISAWTPVPGDGGLALKVALATWLSTSIDNTISTDLQNDKIQH